MIKSQAWPTRWYKYIVTGEDNTIPQQEREMITRRVNKLCPKNHFLLDMRTVETPESDRLIYFFEYQRQ